MLAGIRALKEGSLSVFANSDFFNEIVECRMLWKRSFLVNAPDVIHHVLLDNAENYTRAPAEARLFKSILGHGLITLEGEAWRRTRRVMAPPFAAKQVARLAPGMVKAAREMLDRWDKLPANTVVDIKTEMHHLTFGVITQAMFSASPDADLGRFEMALSRFQEKTRPRVADLIGLPAWFPRWPESAAGGAARTIDDMIRHILAQRRDGGEPRGDLLGMLTEAGLSRREIRDQAATILVAGHETSANALTWTLYLLARHPAEETKLHDELARVLGHREPTHADLANLPRLRMVVEEAMRLYPSTHTFTRQAIGPDRFRDRVIPAGSDIVIPPYVLHRHRRLWKNPDQFDPDRFSPDQIAARPRFAYIPFGAGPRICLGAVFSMVENTLLLAAIAQRYRMQVAPGAVIEPAAHITLRPRYGMPMLLERRQP